MADIFNKQGILISPDVREMQLEFHELRRKKAEIRAKIAPVVAKYNELRKVHSGSHPACQIHGDAIREANVRMAALAKKYAAITRAVEAINVMKQGGTNHRPGVATMGIPGKV